MELKLECLDENMSKDTYVSVRVGEVQKLSRISAGRTFKFPASAVGDRKFGKVEIFNRIGGCSVGIIPADEDQEVAVPINGDSNVKFRVMLDYTEKPPAAKIEEAERIKAKDVNPKVLAAKEYLEKHNLELRLSEAMQAVLREKPEDPAAFIFSTLCNSVGQATFTPAQLQRPATAPAQTQKAASEQVKQMPIQAKVNGSLDATSKDLKKPKEGNGNFAASEDMKAKNARSFLGASADGSLERALSAYAPRETPAATSDLQRLRQQAYDTLAQASTNGRLDEVLAQSTGSAPNSVKRTGKSDEEVACSKGPASTKAEQVRLQTQDILISASASGQLEEALADLHKQVRVETKDILLSASENGKLGDALAKLRCEEFRRRAKETLVEASQSKTLHATLADLKGSQLEQLRMRAKATLCGAASNGKLQATLVELLPAGATRPSLCRQDSTG
mmetsp:Transcript_59524/g.109546  ORF Transcript_59524/g.109546 Transcript_59524/m.109546 type:complete len:449 (-) Transcript_59524:31-1377(-)